MEDKELQEIYNSALFYSRSNEEANEALSNGADAFFKNERGESLLHQIASRDVDIDMQPFVEMGLDVNAKDEDKLTPLHVVEFQKQAQELVNLGADIEARDAIGRTPLSCSNAEVAKILLEAGADIEARNMFGDTPLLSADVEGVSEVLLAAGADINARNNNGDTALHGTSFGQAKLLLENGADVNAQNDKGETMLHFMFYEAEEQASRLGAETMRDDGFKKYGRYEIELVELAVSHGLDMNLQDQEGTTVKKIVETLRFYDMGAEQTLEYLASEIQKDKAEANFNPDETLKDICHAMRDKCSTLESVYPTVFDKDVREGTPYEQPFVNIVQGLIEDGANPRLAMKTMTDLESIEGIKMLENHGAKLEPRQATEALKEAPSRHMIHFLMDNGADANAALKHWARESETFAMTRLGEWAANNQVNTKEMTEGKDSRHFALAEAGHSSVVTSLVNDLGADIHARDALSNTPLHQFLKNTEAKKEAPYDTAIIVAQFIELGAEPRAINRNLESCESLMRQSKFKDSYTPVLEKIDHQRSERKAVLEAGMNQARQQEPEQKKESLWQRMF